MLDANELERMAKERPDECFLKGSGVLKLIGGIRQLEAEIRALRNAEAGPALDVTVERGRVWIKRGVQSFMLAYDSDEEEERQWYAQQLRNALGIGGVSASDLRACDAAQQGDKQ